MASGYVGRIATDPEGFTGWQYDAQCAGCTRGMVPVWLMADGSHIYRPHKYVPRDSTGAFIAGKLVECPNSGKPAPLNP